MIVDAAAVRMCVGECCCANHPKIQVSRTGHTLPPDRAADESRERTVKAQTCLLQAALEFFAHREAGDVTELRLHHSERIIRQLTESFAVTAPWYAR